MPKRPAAKNRRTLVQRQPARAKAAPSKVVEISISAKQAAKIDDLAAAAKSAQESFTLYMRAIVDGAGLGNVGVIGTKKKGNKWVLRVQKVGEDDDTS